MNVVVEDDLRRSRLTVFFRLLLAIPHLVWLVLWTLLVWALWIVLWLLTLVLGRLPGGLHRFCCSYIRYRAHLSAYLTLVANPFPGFTGREGSYPIDVRLPSQATQSRLRTLFRPVLAIWTLSFWSVGWTVSLLGWFVALVTGRVGPGLRDLGALAVGYRAHVRAYSLFVTDRFPTPDPSVVLGGLRPPPLHPARIGADANDLRRSRLMVFFRLPLLIPHLVWLYLWGALALIAGLVQWLVTLIRGRPITALHSFHSAYIRQLFHVGAFGTLVANPFPGFTGRAASYPIDLELPPPGAQSRWKTFFRLLLAYPALAIGSAVNGILLVDAILSWFAALATGRAPGGMRSFSAYALRYSAQTYAYLFFVTDTYPHASPLEGARAESAPAVEAPSIQAA